MNILIHDDNRFLTMFFCMVLLSNGSMRKCSKRNTIHVQHVTNTYVFSVLIQFILVLMFLGLVSQ
jgi:hypothetical protein